MKRIIPLMILCLSVSMTSAQVTFTTTSISTNGSTRGAADMNNDNLDDIISVSSSNVNINYQLPEGGFNVVNIPTTAANNQASWSMAAADFDSNGYTDLLYGGGSGVTFMRANDSGTGFTEISGPEYVFSQRSNFVDINNDGHLDAFVCHDVAPNVYYINDGTGNLIFNQGGLGDYPSGGNYGSVWIDYDNDGDQDMFIAKCGGESARRTNQMHRNNGDGTFTEVAEDLGLADDMQTWSSAWADYDNDGDMDVFVGASTGSHKLMMNNGDLTFSNVTAASGVSNVSQTSIEHVTYDIDNDGNMDIISGGTILYGNGDMTFTDIDFNALNSEAFGDFNSDGFLDAARGGAIQMNNGNSNNWITITTLGVGPDLNGSNRNGIGARVEVVTASGMKIRDIRVGEGFGESSSLNTYVGLGTDDAISSITINWPSGIVDVIEDVVVNQHVVYVEGENPVLGIGDNFVNNLILFPNPATEVINLSVIEGFETAIYSIYDMTGKRVANSKLTATSIDVSSLSAGNYILRFVHEGNIKLQKFIKR